ncbi:MAG: DUF4924 family protein [Paludibacteraceae bacterium]|nr:DUF4924 family protein [Paludibacteraceae bacterium]
MFIASQKKKENIAEYIIYMWQIEDIIRAYKLDIDCIKANIVDLMSLSSQQEKELLGWYESLIDMMRREGVQEKGHLQINKNTIIDLTDLHKALLYSQKYPEYAASYYKALPFIAELKMKQGNDIESDIEVALSFLYGILMLRLQKKEITESTQQAQGYIVHFLSELSKLYILYKDDELEFE